MATTGGSNVHDRDNIVIEDGGHVFRGELVRRVADEKTCLADRTVTDNHAPGEQDTSVSEELSSSGGGYISRVGDGGRERV